MVSAIGSCPWKTDEGKTVKVTIITFVWALFVALLTAWLLMEIVR
jgi:hypothetical protein